MEAEMTRTIRYSIQLKKKPNLGEVIKIAEQFGIPKDTEFYIHGFQNDTPGRVEYLKEEKFKGVLP